MAVIGRDETCAAAAPRLRRALTTIRLGSQALARSRTVQELFERVCHVVVEQGGYRLAWIGLAEDGAERRVCPAAQSGYEEGYLDGLRISWADAERGRGPTGTAIRTGRPVVSRNIPTDPDFEPWRTEAMRRGYASSAALPFGSDGSRPLGALNVYAAEPDAFDEEELSLLASLADDLAFGVAAIRLQEEHDQARTQLVLADRMASMGMMAASVGHEINNPLMAISTVLDVLAQQVPTPEAARLVDEARDAVQRVKAIARDLRTFAREQSAREPLDVRVLLDSAIRIADFRLRSRAVVVREYGEVPLVTGNETRLGQVFLNLLVNAAEAIPAGDATGHRVTVATRTAPDGRAIAEVRDTGIGIAPLALRRLFNPFYTTKPDGTGLGLAISREIVEELGGEILVESTPGKGSVFRVCLPPSPRHIV